MSEVELSVELSCDPLMPAELSTIVTGDGVDAICQRVQQGETGGSDFVDRISDHLFEQY